MRLCLQTFKINLLQLQQCAPADYDSWGIEGWAFDDILPYFKKAEKYHPVEGIPYHEELHGKKLFIKNGEKENKLCNLKINIRN